MSRMKGDTVVRALQIAGGVLAAALAIAGIVWAGGSQSEKLTHHLEEESIHMTPAIHTKLGEISGKLDILLGRTL
jgi:hypothetical protein